MKIRRPQTDEELQELIRVLQEVEPDVLLHGERNCPRRLAFDSRPEAYTLKKKPTYRPLCMTDEIPDWVRQWLVAAIVAGLLGYGGIASWLKGQAEPEPVVSYAGKITIDPPQIYVFPSWHVNRCHAYRGRLQPPVLMNVHSTANVFYMNTACLESERLVAQFETVGRPYVFEHWFDPTATTERYPTVIYVFDGYAWPPEVPQERYQRVSQGGGGGEVEVEVSFVQTRGDAGPETGPNARPCDDAWIDA